MREVEIKDSYHGGDWSIQPVIAIKKENIEYACENIKAVGVHYMAIDECDIAGYLLDFLEVYYDASTEMYCRNECGNGIEGYGYDNLFTYEPMRLMINHIKEFCDKINMEEKDEVITEYLESKYEYKISEWLNENETIEDKICIATNFYERFCDRLERMMNETPEGEFISFMGP